MALTNWSTQQILNQLLTGASWSASVITYAFPTLSSGLYGTTELTGFKALSAAQQATAELSLWTWDDLMTADLQKTTASSSNIEFGFSSTGVSYAHTYLPSVGSLWMNSAYSDLTSAPIGQHGFLTYMHEEGHALGLDHMGNYNGSGNWTPSSYQDSSVYSIMSYFGPNWGFGTAAGEGLVAWADWIGADGRLYAPQTPMLNDIMAIQSLYGVETTTRTGDTTYGFHCNITGAAAQLYDFSANKNPIMALFDSTGNDTLDLSGWSTNSIISLVAGSFSSCNSMTNNISIAYTCDIENAVGGAGADQITGNNLNNRLDGGAGADMLNGGNGDDILIGGAGNDTMDGGVGNDQVNFSESFTSYTYNYNTTLQSWTFINAISGTDVVKNVELFSFLDGVKTVSQLTGTTPAPILPAVSITTTTAILAEGNSASTAFNFTLSLSKASTTAQTVQWTVAGTGSNAAAANDFASALTGTATIAVGQTSAIVKVLVAGDTTVETDETFAVTLSAPSTGLTLGTASATATIRNDDAAPVIPADDYLNSTATTGIVRVNGVATKGVIEKANDCDLFKVTLKAGTSYSFDLVSTGGSLNPYLELYNPGLVSVALNDNASGTTTNAKIIYTAPASGIYYLAAWDLVVGTGSYTLAAKVVTSLNLTGDADNNILTGASYDDVLSGLGGDDMLIGNAGKDTLNGGTGADYMDGGAGNDTYVVDNVGDQVIESSATGGTDLVQASVSYVLATNVENLTLTGTAAINGTGNTLANLLLGNAANNVLDGGSGKDTLVGGNGNDPYVVDNVGDQVIESSAAGGTDWVQASVSYVLATNVENLTLTGTAAINGTGNTLANLLLGNAANNVLNGGSGNDTLVGGNGNDVLYGGAGSDVFVFNFTPNATSNVDTIGDFQTGVDKMQLSKAIFLALGASGTSLEKGQFWSGAGVVKGHDADDRIVYNTTTGVLYYDADGSASTAAVQIALIGSKTHSSLQFLDFQVIS